MVSKRNQDRTISHQRQWQKWISPSTTILSLVLVSGCLTSSKTATIGGDEGQLSTEGRLQKHHEIYRGKACELVRRSSLGKAEISDLSCQKIQALNPVDKQTDEFSIPDELDRRAHFWQQVYTTLTINDYAIHDREHPYVVYEVLSFSKLQRDGYLDSKSKRLIKERKRYYRKLLQQMAKGRVPSSSKADSERISNQFASMLENQNYSFLGASENIRAQKGQREFIRNGIETASRYLQHIEKEFEKEGVPKEMAKLAFIESSFNTKAVSKVGASGVYQIMPFVARAYIRVGDRIDERRDPIKAGRVAAKVLKTNYKILKRWELAITAYNHGPYGLKKAIKAAGTDDIADLVKNYRGKNFGFASQNFYTQFLAMLHILEHKEHFFPEAKLTEPLSYRNHKLQKQRRSKEIARMHKVDIQSLAELNPDVSRTYMLRNGKLPAGYTIKLPIRDNLAENEQVSETVKLEN